MSVGLVNPKFYCSCLLLLAAACAGCHGHRNKAYLELLNAEKRALEDQLYDLAYEREILERKIHAMQQGAAQPAGPLDGQELIDVYPAEEIRDGAIDALPPPSEGGDNRSSTPREPSANPPRLSPPENGQPPPPAIDLEIPSLGATRGGTGHVAEIRLNHLRTGGEDFDSQPGDDGISVLIEPRGPRGEILTQPGRLALVVVDPAAPNEEARIARWNFTESEAAEHLRANGSDRGIRLELPWPQQRPKHSKLHLFVRYYTADGRMLESDREFFITMKGEVANRWTPRSRQRIARQAEQQEQEAEQNRSSAPRMAPVPLEPIAPLRSEPNETSVSEPPMRQVTRPQWRPVR